MPGRNRYDDETESYGSRSLGSRSLASSYTSTNGSTIQTALGDRIIDSIVDNSCIKLFDGKKKMSSRRSKSPYKNEKHNDSDDRYDDGRDGRDLPDYRIPSSPIRDRRGDYDVDMDERFDSNRGKKKHALYERDNNRRSPSPPSSKRRSAKNNKKESSTLRNKGWRKGKNRPTINEKRGSTPGRVRFSDEHEHSDDEEDTTQEKVYKVYDNGDKYHGQIKHNMRHGSGNMIYANGDAYEGPWKNDERSGKGFLILRDGSTYEGEFQRGVANGFGKMTIVDEGLKGGTECFVGLWQNGKFLHKANVVRVRSDSAGARDRAMNFHRERTW